jgi:phosphate starvation-inducible PhoH-like protein
MLEEGVIEISPLAYMRGRTFKNAYIIADEMQNATVNQMKMLLTRLGEGSKMVVTGDLAQADRVNDNGLVNFCGLLTSKTLKHIDIVQFDHKDIERHNAVKEVLSLYGD